MEHGSNTHRTPHGGLVIALDERGTPRIDPSAWIGPGAIIVGDVELGAGSSVWYNAVVRGDSDSVRIGERTNLQDGVVVHTQRGDAAVIGDYVSVGHNAVVHGATIERGCLIGMGSTILSGAVIGEGSLVAAGALVPQGVVIPPRSLVAGVPGRVVRELRDADREAVRRNAELYAGYTERHRDATRGIDGADSA